MRRTNSKNQIAITDVHLRLLAWLDEHEGMPREVMATVLGIKQATLATLVNDLASVGLLARVPLLHTPSQR